MVETDNIETFHRMNRHECHRIIGFICRGLATNDQIADIYSYMLLLFIRNKTLQRYDPSISSYSVYIFRCILKSCQNHKHHNNNLRNSILNDASEMPFDLSSKDSEYDEIDLRISLNTLIKKAKYTGIRKEIFDMSLREFAPSRIAKAVGVKISCVRQTQAEIATDLKKYLY